MSDLETLDPENDGEIAVSIEPVRIQNLIRTNGPFSASTANTFLQRTSGGWLTTKD